MTTILILTVILGAAAAADSIYTVPNLKQEVTSSWSLTHFAKLVRKTILSAVPFPWETVEEILESGESVEIVELAKKLITHELPLLVPACLGLILAVLVPIITLLLGCCRCCCGRGGKLSVQSVKNHKLYRMIINAFIVLTTVGFLSAMAGCISVSGERLKTSPRIVFRTINASLDDIPIFLNMFIDDASDLAVGTLNTAVDDIKVDLDDLPETLSDPVIDGARPFVDKIETNIDVISDDIDYLKVTEAQLNDTVEDMILHTNNLQSGLNTINGLYITIKADCVSEGKTFCGSLPDGAGDDALNISIDTTKLTELAEEVTKLVAEARQVNLTEYKTLGNSTFEDVPDTIRNASQGAIDSVKATLDTVQDDLEPEIDKALEAARFDMDFSDTLDPLDENIRQLEDNDHTIGAVFKLLGFILGIIAMMALVGLLLGVLCTRKPRSLIQTGRTRAGHCGACLLTTSVGLAAFPLLLILLFGSVLMLLGGNLTILCAPLQDLTVFKRLIDSGLLFGGENLGEKFFGDESLNLSVTYLFRVCRNNGTVYSGLNLGSAMNLSSILNADEFVPDLGDSVVDEVNDTIRDISIVDTSMFDDLKSKLELPDTDLNTAQEIEDELNGLDLEAKSREISDLADTIPDQDFADRYRTISTGLQDLHSDTKVPLQQSVVKLTTMIDGLNSTSHKMKAIITDLSTDLDGLTTYIETEAVGVIVQALEEFLDGMKSVPDSLISTILNALGTDIGQCKILADVYDTVVASLCVHFLDAFNVLWASFYTGGMVCIILMISSCTLSKYFRRPDDLLQVRNRAHQNISASANPSVNGTDVVLTHYRSFGDGDRSNNAFFPKQNYRRLHHKWRQRRRFITGPFSAQFFRAGTSEEKQTEKEKDNVQDTNTQTHGCSADNDNMVNNSQSLPSSEENSVQEIVLMVDENQNCIKLSDDTAGEIGPNISKREETTCEITRSKVVGDPVGTVCCISNEHQMSAYSEEACKNKGTSFPYFQLAGDECILIPVTDLKTEGYECNDIFNEMKNTENVFQKHVTGLLSEANLNFKNHKMTEDTFGNDSTVDNDQWFQDYKIESSAEYMPSSPLVKYSCDYEKILEQTDVTDKHNLSNTANETVLSHLGYIESDSESATGNTTDMDVDIPAMSNEGSVQRFEEDERGKDAMNRDSHDHYPLYQVVCSLCRNNVSEDFGTRKYNTSKDELPTFSNNSGSFKGDGAEDQKLLRDDSLVLKNLICNSNIGKTCKSLEDSLQTFENTFRNMSEGNTKISEDQTDHQEDTERFMDKINKTESQSKLDIKVKPYKPLKKMKSPQSAFLFWKSVEANSSSPTSAVRTLPQEKPICNERKLKDSELKTERLEAQGSGGTACHHISSSMIYPTECVEILPENKGNEQKIHASGNEPAALQSLAVAAGRLVYVREAMNRNENNMVRLESEDNVQPQSLANISMAVSSCISDRPTMQQQRCEIATTVKNNTPVSYV